LICLSDKSELRLGVQAGAPASLLASPMSESESAGISRPVDGRPQIERRAWVRYPGRLGAFHLLDNNDEPRCWAQIKEVSRGGVALWLRAPVTVGTRLLMEVPETPGRPALPALMRVIHTTPANTGRWLVGCEFVQPLSEDELQALLMMPACA
jgi:hypothetical protein